MVVNMNILKCIFSQNRISNLRERVKRLIKVHIFIKFDIWYFCWIHLKLLSSSQRSIFARIKPMFSYTGSTLIGSTFFIYLYSSYLLLQLSFIFKSSTILTTTYTSHLATYDHTYAKPLMLPVRLPFKPKRSLILTKG